MMSDITKTPREELECKKKYLYEHSMFWECNEGSKCQILEEDVCDLLNELNKEFEDCEKLLDSKDDFIHKFKRDIEELGISIKLFEDDIATKDKKIDEQQAEIERLKEQLSLVCKAESSSPYNSVKEVLRRQIFGLDCAAQESANAWNHYCVLSKLFEEQYGEHWDNFD